MLNLTKACFTRIPSKLRIKISAAFILIASLQGCSVAVTTAEVESSTEANKQLILQFFEIFSTGDILKAKALIDEDASWWVAGRKEDGVCFAGDYNRESFFKAVADRRLQSGKLISNKPYVVSMIAEGDRVAVEARSDGVLREGGKYENEFHFLFIIKQGKIVTIRQYLDTAYGKRNLC